MPAARPCTVAAAGSSAGPTRSSRPAWRSDTTSRNAPARTVASSGPAARRTSAAATAPATGSAQPEQDVDDELVEALVAVATGAERVEAVDLGLECVGLGGAAAAVGGRLGERRRARRRERLLHLGQ